MLENWLRIANYKKDTVLHDTYLCNLTLMGENKSCWLNNIYDLVYNKLGAKHLWDYQGTNGKNHACVNKLVGQLKHLFNFQWKKCT